MEYYNNNQDRRQQDRRLQEPNHYYATSAYKITGERRKITRRAFDRGIMWRRRFWRDVQRQRLDKSIQDNLKLKLDNLAFSEKRMVIHRAKIKEQKALQEQQEENERARLANYLAMTNGLNLTDPVKIILNNWNKIDQNLKKYKKI